LSINSTYVKLRKSIITENLYLYPIATKKDEMAQIKKIK
jgi:hypothetical protein